MSITRSGDFQPSRVPTVFVEAPQARSASAGLMEEQEGAAVRRGALAVLMLILVGILIASTVGLFWLAGQRAAELADAKASLSQTQELLERRTAQLSALEYDFERYRDYDQLESLRSQVREEQRTIEHLYSMDLARSRPLLPRRLQRPQNLMDDPLIPARTALERRLAELREHRTRLLTYVPPPRSVVAPGPATPRITSSNDMPPR